MIPSIVCLQKMTEAGIIRGIEKTVNSIWTIGITDNPDRRYGEHRAEGKNVKNWRYWEAGSEEGARRIEYFLDRGMKGDTGGGTNPTYVYIF